VGYPAEEKPVPPSAGFKEENVFYGRWGEA